MISIDILILLIVIALFFVMGGVIALFILNKVRWPMNWELYEELIPGQLKRTKKGKMRLLSFGDGGEEIFFLKWIKAHRAAYGRRIDPKTVAWAKGQDGYWYNINFDGIDKNLAKAGVMPVDRDMRMANATTRKMIDVEYKKLGFMEKYGTIIAFTMLFLCILAMGATIYVTVDKQREISNTNLEATKATKDLIETTNNLLNKQDNILNGGSGIIPAAS